MENISNIALYKLFKNNKQFKDDCKYIKSETFCFRMENERKQEIIEEILENLCNILDENFKTSKNIQRPTVKIIEDAENFGEYKIEENAIYLDKKSLNIPNIMHEFRHYIQAQFEEKSRIESVKVPLPDPFYRLQGAERNAYNFQHLFRLDNVKIYFLETVHDTMALLDNGASLFALGLLHKKYFDLARQYFKPFNHIGDIQKTDEKKLKYKNVVRQKINVEFKNKFYDLILDKENNNKYFHVTSKFGDDFSFSIIDNKCTVYPIESSKEHLVSNYKTSIDFVINFCKIYNVKDIDICPISNAIHRAKFDKILLDIKSNYTMTDDSKSNEIHGALPNNDITENLKKKLIKIEEKAKEQFTIDQILLKNERMVQLDKTNTIYLAGYDSQDKNIFLENFDINIQKLFKQNNLKFIKTEETINVDFKEIEKILKESLNSEDLNKCYDDFNARIKEKFGISIDRFAIDDKLNFGEEELPENIKNLSFTNSFIKSKILSLDNSLDPLENECYDKISRAMLLKILQNGTSSKNNLFVFNMDRNYLNFLYNPDKPSLNKYIDTADKYYYKTIIDKAFFEIPVENVEKIIEYNKDKFDNEKDFEKFKKGIKITEEYNMLIKRPKNRFEIDLKELNKISIEKDEINR